MLWVIHVDHRSKKFIHLDGKVANVGTLAAAEYFWITTDMPNILMASEGAVSGALRERGAFDQDLLKELKW